MSTRGADRNALLIFARAPVAGEAKTRLIPALGAAGAARLQQRLTEHALATAARTQIGSVQLWCTPSPTHPFFVDCARRYPIAVRTQSGLTLGERLAFAAVRELPGRDAIVIIGTDCPVLTDLHLRAALDALQESDAVIYPAEDGGYVLLGLACQCPEVFSGIDWGSKRVFDQTMQNLSGAGRRVSVRETLWDVDTPADFERLARCMPGWADVAVQPHANLGR